MARRLGGSNQCSILTARTKHKVTAILTGFTHNVSTHNVSYYFQYMRRRNACRRSIKHMPTTCATALQEARSGSNYSAQPRVFFLHNICYINSGRGGGGHRFPKPTSRDARAFVILLANFLSRVNHKWPFTGTWLRLRTVCTRLCRVPVHDRGT